MKLTELFEAMSIANVSIDDAKQEGNNYIINRDIGGAKYELRFYGADSDASKFAGVKDDMWAFSFRVAPAEKTTSRKGSGGDDGKDFKMQNFNNGAEFKVMPIIMGYIVDFIKQKKPKAFMFASDKGEASRVSLYKKIAERYASTIDQLGYRALSDKETRMDATKTLHPFIFIRK